MAGGSMPKKKAPYADDTVREHQHAELDKEYSERDVDQDATITGETPTGRPKDFSFDVDGGVAVIDVGGQKVRLDRDACNRLAKVAKRAAQAVA
jgi:hypothetical protein